MSAFAGVVCFDGASPDKKTEAQICRTIVALQAGRVDVVRAPGALFVRRTTPSAPYGAWLIGSEHGRPTFAAVSRLSNREELAAALQISSSALAATSDAVLLLRMLERWGDAGIARCIGPFAFAQWDAEARRLILARDCLGERPLFFHRGKDFAAFATGLGALLAIPGVPRELDDIVLANYLALNLDEPRRTFYRGVERVASRTLVTADRERLEHRHYWSPNFAAPPPYRREQDYVERTRELLDQAVATATRDTPRVAIATSGGLDSSAVAATAARLGRAERITCYTLVSAAGTQIDFGRFKYPDERQKLEALGRMHPTLDIQLLAPERPHRLEEDDTRHFVRASAPVLNPSNSGHFSFLYDAVAAAGYRQLLMGFLGNPGLTWTGSLSLVSLFRSAQWRAFARELPALARDTDRGLARTLVGEFVVPAAPAALRRLIIRLRGRDPDSVARYSALNPDFVAAHGLAAQWRAHGFDPWFTPVARHPAQLRAHYLFDNNQFGRDGMGASFDRRGFEITDPYADRRLAEFVLTVPEPMFRQNGISRSFARSVLADRLPRRFCTSGVAAPRMRIGTAGSPSGGKTSPMKSTAWKVRRRCAA